jgi:hypothetical protein
MEETYSSEKNRLAFNGLHGVISQIVDIFVTTRVRTSDPPLCVIFECLLKNNTVRNIYYSRKSLKCNALNRASLLSNADHVIYKHKHSNGTDYK